VGGSVPEPPSACWLGLRPHTPALLLSPTAVAFVKCVYSIERTLLLRKITDVTHCKCFGFVFSAFSCLFSHLKLCSFCWCEQKIFCPRAPGFLVTTTDKIIVIGLVYSGVARVPCALGQEIFLRPLQQNLQSLN